MHNDRALEWNNAYSLWLAREYLARGALLVNGDTVHPVSVEKSLLAASEAGGDGRGRVLIAVDDVKPLAAEEMKVVVDDRGLLTRITKQMDPAQAYGEYIGVTLIEPPAAMPLADALETTWRRDPGPVLRGRLPGAGGPGRRGRRGADRRCRLGGGRQPQRSAPGPRDCRSLLVSRRSLLVSLGMPLLARMLSAPLVIDVRPGAIAGLGDLLADRRIAT